MRFEGNALLQGDTQVGRLVYKAQRWHWHAATAPAAARQVTLARESRLAA